jgi:iron complex outermembrane recepter protein
VRSIVTGKQSFNEAKSGRVSAIFRPTDWLNIEGVYQRQETNSRSYTMVESANILDPAQPASPVFITAEDRLSIQGGPSPARQTFDTFTWRAEILALGQKLIYAGNHRSQCGRSKLLSDLRFRTDHQFPLDRSRARNSVAERRPHDGTLRLCRWLLPPGQ